MKHLYFILFFAPLCGFSQNYLKNWKGLFSYNQIKAISSGSDNIYVAAQNAIFSYNPGTRNVEKISSIDGLSGKTISTLYYADDYDLVLIGYEDGLIDVYDIDSQTVLKVFDIFEKETISRSDKRINHFAQHNGKALISTNYGISVYDLKRLEFGDTYYIGNNGNPLKINQTVVFNDVIYAASEDQGILSVSADDPNLIDYKEWQTLAGGSWSGLNVFQNQLYGLRNAKNLYHFQNGELQPTGVNFQEKVLQSKAFGSRFLAVTADAVLVFDNNLAEIANSKGNAELVPHFTSAVILDQEILIGDQKLGLLKTTFSAPSAYLQISPIGPLRNDVFDLDVVLDELWVVYGGYNRDLNPYPLSNKKKGVSHLIRDGEEKNWINIPYELLDESLAIAKATINPKQTNQVFLSSFHDGLLEIVDDELSQHYDENNGDLPGVLPTDIRLNGADFDAQGNLWVTNSQASQGLLRFNGADFNFYDVTSVIPDVNENMGFTDLVISDLGDIYFGSGGNGVIGYDPNTQYFVKVRGEEEQGNLPSNYVLSLALDHNNQLWIGTEYGLRVLYNPSQMFTDPATSTNAIIVLDDDGVAQELLAGLTINAIAVDGSNNKWIATSSGVFYLSSDGQKTIYKFTSDNSPLPSNLISDIAIDGSSGLVYIGTEQGLLAFKGTATDAQEDLSTVRAFPNPVRPGYSGVVTIDGLMANADVKITDIEGNLVYEKVTEGGNIQWDTCAFGRHKVASGVYMVLITSADQLDIKVTKIMIIR